jgi:hypothetical protein
MWPPDPTVTFNDVTKTVTITMQPTKLDCNGYSFTYNAIEIIGVEFTIKNPSDPFYQFAEIYLLLRNKSTAYLGPYPLDRANKIREQIFQARMRTGADDRERLQPSVD